jgi:hypothetical protein
MKIKRNILTILIVFGFLAVSLGIWGITYSIRNRSCIPINVMAKKRGDNSIEISWETEAYCLGYILYGDNGYEIERVGINPEKLGKSKTHEIVIENLLSTNTYYFMVVSNEKPFGRNGKPIVLSLDHID